jgi:hypothetical protein
MALFNENKTMADGPIYIGGLDRCGKTTMQAFLSSHPRIAIPHVGSNLWRYFYGQYGDLAVKENFERCLRAMLAYSHVQVLNPDAERIRRDFGQGQPTYARLFALLHEHYAQQLGKPRWGDQTGLLEGYADHLFAAHADAKMIHMVRDPRDRYEASLARSPQGKGRAGGATARWLYSMRMARRNQRRYPDRYMTVRYETLVTQPQQTIAAVCDFLGEKFFPEMLLMNGSPYHRDKLAQKASGGTGVMPLTTDYIGRYRVVVPMREIAYMQMMAGREMVAHGYTLDRLNFSPADWLRFVLVECPSNLVRAFSWRSIEAAHDHLPTWFGRKPDAKTLRSPQAKQGSQFVDEAISG